MDKHPVQVREWLRIKPLVCDCAMTATCIQTAFIPVVVFIVFLAFESVGEILKCDHSSESH